jgi:DNA-binding PucR family transcriptional regulator
MKPVLPQNLVTALDPGTEATTLRHIIESVGAPAIHVLAAPRGLDRQVRATVLFDPIDRLAAEPDALLLLAGMRADDQTAVDLIKTAAGLGYCAIVIKRRGAEVSALVTEASIHGIAVLATADEVSWRHLDALLLSVLGSQGQLAESASAVGDELFALANAISAVIGGSVAIEDLDRRVLAYSSSTDQRIDALREQSILERRVPDMERNPQQYRAVLTETGVVRFEERSDEFARSAIAIRAGEQPLGTIWAIEAESGLSAEGERALVEGAQLCALKMLRTINATGIEPRSKESALLSALDGTLTANETVFRLSLPAGGELSLAGFAAVPSEDGSIPLITQIAQALGRYIAAYRPDAAMATTARAIYVVLPGRSDEAANRFVSGALSATSKSFGTQIRAAISTTVNDPTELANMRKEIDDILRVTTAHKDLPHAARLEDVHTRVLLAHVADELVHTPRLRHPGIVAMTAYDHEHGTEFGKSLMCWLQAIGDVGAAARELGVHPNTLRYRLRRSAELFGISLDHPDDRLAVWMQLRLVN